MKCPRKPSWPFCLWAMRKNKPEEVQGLYLHIPFCVRKCHYCDFNSRACSSAERSRYLKALNREIGILGTQETGTHLSSVYIGGGTPSLLSPGELAELLDTVSRGFSLQDEAEITVEVNPGTVDYLWFHSVRDLGISRISLGVQSFVDGELAGLGRIHRGNDATDAVMAAYRAGLENISLDLMQGIPGQTEISFAGSLRRAVDLPIRHLSCYELKVEEGTLFHGMQQRGTLNLPGEEELSAMDRVRREILQSAGFERYEISNYAREGHRSRHNLLYWKNLPYLGAGTGACSRTGNLRRTNTTEMGKYLESLEQGTLPPAHLEPISEEMSFEETVFLGLRLLEGLDFSVVDQRYGIDFMKRYNEEAGRFLEYGLLERTPRGIRLTERGLDMGNQVMAALIRQEG